MPKWTPDQQTAIDDRGGALLVSAAAGSGKTAVLTERVLRRLMDEKDPVDIDRLLLVTFTNAAAAEMRERIGAALGAAVAANPRDTRLRRQLFLVHRAKITTVHALCLSLARERQTQRVHGRDFRAVHEEQLPPQTGIPRVCGYSRTEGRTDSLTHFGCRRIGKRNQQQAVDIDRILLIHQPTEYALGQYGGLARAGCRRN